MTEEQRAEGGIKERQGTGAARSSDSGKIPSSVLCPLSSVQQLPLSGRHLIDASAGTGKTYTISGLVVRLLLERDLAIRDILVVTYTEAATEDLRVRVREKIRQALDCFAGGESNDPFLAGLLAGRPDPNAARLRLSEALRDFDEAAIFTIHGFCQRLLRENSLESGALMDAELVIDEQPLLREIIEDYWRRQVYSGPPLRVAYLVGRLDPDKLLALLRLHLHDHHLRIIPRPQVDEPRLAAAEARFQAAFAAVRAAWSQARPEVAEILTRNQGLNRNRYRPASIRRWLEAMDSLCPSPELFDGFERLTVSGLAAGVKNGCTAPEHQFFVLAGELAQAGGELLDLLEEHLLAFKAELFSLVRREMRRRKQQRAIYCFDDLLQQVHQGLRGAGGERLARAVRERYPAALIDEFQDTDPVQYEIFVAIYREPGSLLFLIGDPKQAIYSFRGADIFAYFRACREVDGRYSLGVNYRSTAGLVRAVNLLFSGPRDPFVFKEIEFAAVQPAQEAGAAALRLAGLASEPLQLWFVERRQEDQSGPLALAEGRERVLRATAAEIVQLLELGREGRALLHGRPVAAGDIAVLVRSNREAQLMQDTLIGCGVPGVLHSTENLFAGREAAELARLLAAVAEPADENKLRLALATEIIGVDGAELAGLAENENGWEEWLLKFRHYHELWRDCGFIRMLRLLLRREGVRPRLLAYPDGERRLTNILHLMEVLHRAAATERLGMAGLRKFLAERLGTADEQVDEYLLRLESDAERVRIVTIHKAKGLEYPIVFCPFCWQGTRKDKPPFLFHHPEEEYRPVLDLGSVDRDRHGVIARQEELAENLRLLYVALTRARERCYLVWGAFKGAESSALAHLLHQPVEGAATMSDAEMLAELERLAVRSEGALGLRIMEDRAPAAWHPGGVPAKELAGRSFSGSISGGWRVTSYSGLVHGSRPRPPEPQEREMISAERLISGNRPEPGGTARPLGILDFPQGAAPGIFLHELLEHLDFSDNQPGARERLVRSKLAAHGYEQRWLEPLLKMLDQVLGTPLAPDLPGLTLAAVRPEQRLDELEFYFPLTASRPVELGAILAASGRPWAAQAGQLPARLSWPELRGFCKGFIDLVFVWQEQYFIIDWKSNFLGPRLDDYQPSRLNEVMLRELYILQYHLYVVALHRYLAGRLPGYRYESHFGGVFYLFLRGMDRDRGWKSGIFHERPAFGLVEEIERVLGR